jgi:glycerol dehydrogenase
MFVRIFGAPHRYIQGAGAIAELPPLVAGYGRRPFIVADGASTEEQRARIEELLRGATERVVFGLGGKSRAADVDRLAEAARALDADLVLGFGGAVAMNLAKALRAALDLPLVTIPTTPACHAPVSRIIELDGEEEKPAAARMMPTSPDVVLVDTTIIATAAPRLFIAGLGDALALRFEVERQRAAGALNALGGRATQLAAAAAEAAYAALREHAAAALAAMVRREPDETLERVVEAMMLLAGVGYESGGPSVAHALARGFAMLPVCRTALHGELVAFALLAELVLDGQPIEALRDLVAFYRSLGLPVRLAEIGVVGDKGAAISLAARHGSKAMAMAVPASQLADAIARADSLPID